MEGVVEWQSATPMPTRAKRAKDPDWEQKQRLREYRVAARREKRNRKADEKKQRKLNATILRRMTRNPEKYTKNIERNRLRAIEGERRTIYAEAVKQAQRLAAIHDPSGAMFNVGPVIKQEDGTVLPLEVLRKREERLAAKKAAEDGALLEVTTGQKGSAKLSEEPIKKEAAMRTLQNFNSSDINPDREAQMGVGKREAPLKREISKSQQKKLAMYQPREPPPKPKLPDGILIPEGEENWIKLWDLPELEIERRVLRAKRRKVIERKNLRTKQQSGKVERRAARDEKRRIYRDLKYTWKSIKEEEKRHKIKIKSAEDEEAKKIAVQIATKERKLALDICEAFGFTFSNTEGVEDIKPKVLGMKGMEVNFDALELGNTINDVRPRATPKGSSLKRKRVDLSAAARSDGVYVMPTSNRNGEDVEEFIKFDVGDGQDHAALVYNHKVRRKLRRAMEAADIAKEKLVRERTVEYCKEKDIEPPPELFHPLKPIHLRGERALENGTLETPKGERVRLRMELAEFNKAAKVLRKQAKDIAMYAGLRVYAEMTGRIPPGGALGNEDNMGYEIGWIVPEEKPLEEILRPDKDSSSDSD